VKKIAVIGSGFSGLSAAACLAKEGFDVTVFEKNQTPGGRARSFESQGFTFDMVQAGIGCPMCSRNTFSYLESVLPIISH
jgi:phytoene dehydrogenase-like protein